MVTSQQGCKLCLQARHEKQALLNPSAEASTDTGLHMLAPVSFAVHGGVSAQLHVSSLAMLCCVQQLGPFGCAQCCRRLNTEVDLFLLCSCLRRLD